MFPTGWAGARHSNARFLFRDLSAWVTVSASSKQVISLEWGGMKTKVPAIWWSDTRRAWSRKPMKSRLLLTATATENVNQVQHPGRSSTGAALGDFIWVFFKTKSLGPVQSPESKQFIRGEKKVEVLFHTPNKFCLEQRRVKMKYKRTRNNGLAFCCFVFGFVFNIGVKSVFLSKAQ